MSLPRQVRLPRRSTPAPRLRRGGQPPERVPPPPPSHSAAEVEQATAGLETVDLKRLRLIARVLVGRNVDSAGRDDDDLVSEAVLRTLQGTRAWRRGVDFMHHLAETMRSVAWEWRQQSHRRAEAGLVPLPGARQPETLSAGDDFTPDPVESAVSPDPGAEALAIARDRLRVMVETFADDPTATAVLEGWADGSKGPEIQQRHGMTEKAFRAAVRRIRRFALRGEP